MSVAATIPPQYRALAHYIKIGNEHKERDIVTYYWCLYYAAEAAMKIDKSSPECKKFLVSTLNELETIKSANRSNDAISTDMVGQAHVEGTMLKLHTWADDQDRAGVFNKNVVKAFYTSGHLVDVLKVFGELDESMSEIGRYDKWKATYIHNCLKQGETPIAGPAAAGGEFAETSINVPPPPPPVNEHIDRYDAPPSRPTPPASAVSSRQPPEIADNDDIVAPIAQGMQAVKLTTAQYVQAGKYAKWAISAMQYEDSKAAAENLRKALNLMTVGHE